MFIVIADLDRDGNGGGEEELDAEIRAKFDRLWATEFEDHLSDLKETHNKRLMKALQNERERKAARQNARYVLLYTLPLSPQRCTREY